jgi:hypothetical protein
VRALTITAKIAGSIAAGVASWLWIEGVNALQWAIRDNLIR